MQDAEKAEWGTVKVVDTVTLSMTCTATEVGQSIVARRVFYKRIGNIDIVHRPALDPGRVTIDRPCGCQIFCHFFDGWVVGIVDRAI